MDPMEIADSGGSAPPDVIEFEEIPIVSLNQNIQMNPESYLFEEADNQDHVIGVEFLTRPIDDKPSAELAANFTHPSWQIGKNETESAADKYTTHLPEVKSTPPITAMMEADIPQAKSDYYGSSTYPDHLDDHSYNDNLKRLSNDYSVNHDDQENSTIEDQTTNISGGPGMISEDVKPLCAMSNLIGNDISENRHENDSVTDNGNIGNTIMQTERQIIECESSNPKDQKEQEIVVDTQNYDTLSHFDQKNVGITFNFSNNGACSKRVSSRESRNNKDAETIRNYDVRGYMNGNKCSQVLANLKKQQADGKFCDITIIVGDQSYKVHKCVLASSSSYLTTLLSVFQDKIFDISMFVSDANIFEVILEYMYSGQMTLSMSVIEELMFTCRKLQIDDVFECCTAHLRKSLLQSNWLQILTLAKQFDLKDVVNQAIDFFITNFTTLYESDNITKLSTEEVCDILEKCNPLKDPELELNKLDLLLYWILGDYDIRLSSYIELLSHIDHTLFTQEGFESIMGQNFITNHEIFHHSLTLDLIIRVRDSLLQKLYSEDQTSEQICEIPVGPPKLEKHGRPKNKMEYKVEPHGDKISNNGWTSKKVAVIPKKRRGRPSKYQQMTEETTQETNLKDTEELISRISLVDNTKDTNSEQIENKRDIPNAAAVIEKKADDTSSDKAPIQQRGSKGKKARALPDGFVCITCGKLYNSRKQLTRHRLNHREKTKGCDLCDYKATRNDKVKEHIKRMHPEQAFAKGFISPEKFEKRKQEKIQKATHGTIVRTRKKPKEAEAVQCPKCPRKFASLTLLGHHIKGHGVDIPLLCEICGFSTRHYASMNIHKKIHNGKAFKCPFPGCDYENVRKSRIDDHMSIHTGSKNHVCSVCGKSFAGRKHMQRHEKLHSELKQLSCKNCLYQTNRRDKLNDHIRKHHPDTGILMGILDPAKMEERKLRELARPPKLKKLRKKTVVKPEVSVHSLKVTDSSPQVSNLKTSTSQPMDSSLMVMHQDADHTNNYVTMALPQQLLGASSFSEEMMQYLTTSFSTNPKLITTVPTSVSHVIPVSGVQAESVQTITEQNLQMSEARDNTWVYHIVPEGQQQY